MRSILTKLAGSFWLLIVCHTWAAGQSYKELALQHPGVKGYFNQLKFTPLKLIGWVNPGVELSYERMYKSRWSTQLTGTYLLPRPPLSIFETTVDPEKKGFKVAVEQKYYLRKLGHKGTYVAGEVDYMHSRNWAAMDFESSAQQLYRDTFELTKNNIALNVKFGYYTSFKRIIIDFYGGIGLQYRNATHSGRINPQDGFAPVPNFNFPTTFNREGRSWNVSIPLSFRIGYLF